MAVYNAAEQPAELKHAIHVQRCMLAKVARGQSVENRRRALEERNCRLHERKARLSRPASAPHLGRMPSEQRVREAQMRHDQICYHAEQERMAHAMHAAERELQAGKISAARWHHHFDQLRDRQDASCMKHEKAEETRRRLAKEREIREAKTLRRLDHNATRRELKEAMLLQQEQKRLIHRKRADSAAKRRERDEIESKQRAWELDENWENKKYMLEVEAWKKLEKLEDAKWLRKQVLTRKHALQEVAQRCDYTGNYDPLLAELYAFEAEIGLTRSSQIRAL
eukprot:TRINITY_DN59376_c0_g1_i1.p1 TRINITY_DN59376_c0_g1~~TRINITY_DN59376_c0_g1_i1.p1  ORF type:complete len:282 (+),score=65.91 TRINITY_DN59376_c0_g1_i1:198-1043(+)